MSYTPPANNAVNFDDASVSYTPPAYNAVNFDFSDTLFSSVTGIAATGAIGTVTCTITVGASGSAGTGAVGTAIATTGPAATGVAAAGAVGSPAIAINAVPSGIPATGSVGTGAVAIYEPTDGGADSTTGGTLTEGVTGVAASSAIGTVTITTTHDASPSVTGVAAAGAVGTVVCEIDKGASGSAGTGAVGTSIPQVSATPFGVRADSAVNDVTITRDAFVYPTGVAAAGAVGVVGKTVAPDGVGVQAVDAIGTTYGAIVKAVTGVAAAVPDPSNVPEVQATPAGVQADSGLGDVTTALSVEIGGTVLGIAPDHYSWVQTNERALFVTTETERLQAVTGVEKYHKTQDLDILAVVQESD